MGSPTHGTAHRPGASIGASEDRKADRVLEHRRGVDHSAHSREAARFAADLAERLGLRLVIAHALSATVPAFHPHLPGKRPPDRGEGVSRTRYSGERLVSEIVKRGGEAVRAPIAGGYPIAVCRLLANGAPAQSGTVTPLACVAGGRSAGASKPSSIACGGTTRQPCVTSISQPLVHRCVFQWSQPLPEGLHHALS
jgi:hypothetical protein